MVFLSFQIGFVMVLGDLGSKVCFEVLGFVWGVVLVLGFELGVWQPFGGLNGVELQGKEKPCKKEEEKEMRPFIRKNQLYIVAARGFVYVWLVAARLSRSRQAKENFKRLLLYIKRQGNVACRMRQAFKENGMF